MTDLYDAIKPHLADLIAEHKKGVGYVELAKIASKRIGRKVSDKYVWTILSEAGVPRERMASSVKAIKDAEEKANVEEFDKLAGVATAFGFRVVRLYMPWLDRQLSEGHSLDFIVDDIMRWRLERETTLAKVTKLEAENHLLQEQVTQLEEMTLPNYRFTLTTQLLHRYAQDVLRARVYGVRLNPRHVLRAFYNDLQTLEANFKVGMTPEVEPING